MKEESKIKGGKGISSGKKLQQTWKNRNSHNINSDTNIQNLIASVNTKMIPTNLWDIEWSSSVFSEVAERDEDYCQALLSGRQLKEKQQLYWCCQRLPARYLLDIAIKVSSVQFPESPTVSTSQELSLISKTENLKLFSSWVLWPNVAIVLWSKI